MRIPILLDYVNDVMFFNEFTHCLRKRECSDPAIVEADILRLQAVQRFLAGTIAAAHGQDRRLVERREADIGFGHQGTRGLPLHEQPVKPLLVLV